MENIFLRQALNHSLVYATISILISVIIWITNLFSILGLMGNAVIGILNLVIMYSALLIFTKHFRNNYLDGYMDFGKAYLYGLIIIVGSSFLVMFYNFIFFSYIDPGYTEKMLMVMQEKMSIFLQNKGLSEDKIDEVLSKFKDVPIQSPFQTAKSGFVQSVILGAILALISAAFARKSNNTDPFKDVQ
jgi:hypothetical protein